MLQSYVEVYEMLRGITGTGAGKGPYISIHDGFLGLEEWAGFLTGADRLTLDIHPYFAFDGQPNTAPIDTGTGPGAGGTWPQLACQAWAPGMNTRFDCSLHSKVADSLIPPLVVQHLELQLLENLATVSTTVVFSFLESAHQQLMVGIALSGKMRLNGLLVRKQVYYSLVWPVWTL